MAAVIVFFECVHDHKFRPAQKTLQNVDKPADVSLVERRVDFVQHTKGTGPELENGHQQRHRRECFFTSAQQRIAKRRFPRWRCDDFNARFEWINAFFQDDVSVSTTEGLSEQFLKVPANGFEGFDKKLSTICVDSDDDFFERLFGLDQILVLFVHFQIAGFQFLQFGQGFDVHSADAADFFCGAT